MIIMKNRKLDTREIETTSTYLDNLVERLDAESDRHFECAQELRRIKASRKPREDRDR
jgi:hypothetical protein